MTCIHMTRMYTYDIDGQAAIVRIIATFILKKTQTDRQKDRQTERQTPTLSTFSASSAK